MSDLNPDVEFLGIKVSAGKSFSLSDLIPEDDLGVACRPHITNVALGPDPKPGRHTVFAEGSGTKAVVGTLEMGRCEQFQIDFVARDLVFSHTGKSDVYLTGYNTTSFPYYEGSTEEDEEDDSEEDDAVPQGIPLKKSQLMPSKEAAAKQLSLLDDEATSSDDEEDDEEDEDEEDEEEDSEDDEAAKKQKGIAYLKHTLTAQPLNGTADTDDEDDDDDGEEEDDDDDDMQDDDEDDEEDVEEDGILGLQNDNDESSEEEDDSGDEAVLAEALKAAVPGSKRAAAPKVTPQPSKKAKVAPATTPAASAKPQTAAPNSTSGVSGPAAAQWQSALKAYLMQSGGATDMSKLGGVKKPEGIPKGQRLKAFLQQHPTVFAIDGNSVTLKK